MVRQGKAGRWKRRGCEDGVWGSGRRQGDGAGGLKGREEENEWDLNMNCDMFDTDNMITSYQSYSTDCHGRQSSGF